MTVQATITLDRSEDVLTVTASLLGKPDREGNYTLFVWNDAAKTTEERPVVVGLNNNITAEIKSGVSEGDLIVAERVTGGNSAAMQMRRPRGLGF